MRFHVGERVECYYMTAGAVLQAVRDNAGWRYLVMIDAPECHAGEEWVRETHVRPAV
jgi:hypothetical protein